MAKACVYYYNIIFIKCINSTIYTITANPLHPLSEELERPLAGKRVMIFSLQPSLITLLTKLHEQLTQTFGSKRPAIGISQQLCITQQVQFCYQLNHFSVLHTRYNPDIYHKLYRKYESHFYSSCSST